VRAFRRGWTLINNGGWQFRDNASGNVFPSKPVTLDEAERIVTA
jgi:hypothetical protein